jgi:prefoldin subunit 5
LLQTRVECYLSEKKNRLQGHGISNNTDALDNFKVNSYEGEIETFVHLGSGTFVQGRIPFDNFEKSIFVHIGFGFHAEIEIENISQFVSSRKAILNGKISLMNQEVGVLINDINQVCTLCYFSFLNY